jgi:dTDP-N-acetylfucosamine:lipid II N-acetylfucosaminyltransferase
MSKIVHIMHNDKFIKPFIDFIEKSYDNNEHLFIFLYNGDENNFPIPKSDNIINTNNLYCGKKKLWKLSNFLTPILRQSDKIILHSLFLIELIDYLYLHQRFLKKCYWVMWGGDLYDYENSEKTIKSTFFKHRKAKIIR